MLKMIEPSHNLEKIVGKFSKDQLRLIMENVGAIQLTEGCNSCCPDCGVGALPKVRDYIPFDFLKYLFSEFKNELHTRVPFLYYASEPFDYNDGTHTYIDVHGMFEKECETNPCVVTSIPKGWEKSILGHVLNNNSLGYIANRPDRFINAISITRLNSERIENAFYELIPELEIEKQIKIKSRYEISYCDEYSDIFEDGTITRSFIMTKRFVLMNFEEISEKLGLKDAAKFYLNGINNTTRLSSETKIKRDENNCLVEYLRKYGSPDQKTVERIMKRSEKVREQLNAQKRYFSISRNYMHKTDGQLYIVPLPNGDYLAEELQPITFFHIFEHLCFIEMGISVRDYRNPNKPKQIHDKRLGPGNINTIASAGIGCFHGTLITPKGIFNLQTRKPSEDYPYGQRIIPIDPNNFSVAKYYYLSSSIFTDIIKESRKFRLISL